MKLDDPQDQPDALSPEETAALLSMSDSFVQEAVHMSRHYTGCSRHPSAIDPTRWKRIAHVRSLAMYKGVGLAGHLAASVNSGLALQRTTS